MENPRLIVMPFVPDPGEIFTGTGLSIHFLLGNLFAVHPGLTECWFGWRVKKIFPDGPGFSDFCRGNAPLPDIASLGVQEKVRYWLTGSVSGGPGILQVSMALHDIHGNGRRITLPLSLDDGMLDFRHRFLEWIAGAGLAFPGTDAVLWPEWITAPGLDSLGRGLEVLYLNYITQAGTGADPIDLAWFDQAVVTSPRSYLAQDLKGWGLYKNQAILPAQAAFETALALNETGVGALSGLLWCAVQEKNRNKALGYALAKARVTGNDPAKARAWVEKKITG